MLRRGGQYEVGGRTQRARELPKGAARSRSRRGCSAAAARCGADIASCVVAAIAAVIAAPPGPAPASALAPVPAPAPVAMWCMAGAGVPVMIQRRSARTAGADTRSRQSST